LPCSAHFELKRECRENRQHSRCCDGGRKALFSALSGHKFRRTDALFQEFSETGKLK